MAYATHDASIRRVVSVAGIDLSELNRQMQQNLAFYERFTSWLLSTRGTQGPARFDFEADRKVGAYSMEAVCM